MAGAKAAGGDALASVKSLAMNETGSMFNQGNEAPIKVSWLVSYPDRSHGQVEFQGQTIMQVCDGKSAWLQFPDKVVDASRFLPEFERGIAMFGGGWGAYQRVLEGKLAGQFIGEEEIDGKKAEGVQLEAPFKREVVFRSQYASARRCALPVRRPARDGGQRPALGRLPNRGWKAVRLHDDNFSRRREVSGISHRRGQPQF